MSADPRRILTGKQLDETKRELLAGDRRGVGCEDPRRFLDDLREGVVGGALAVRKRSPPQCVCPFRLEVVGELTRETRLTYARWPDNGDQSRSELGRGSPPRAHEKVHLGVPPDEGRARDRALGGRG